VNASSTTLGTHPDDSLFEEDDEDDDLLLDWGEDEDKRRRELEATAMARHKAATSRMAALKREEEEEDELDDLDSIQDDNLSGENEENIADLLQLPKSIGGPLPQGFRPNFWMEHLVALFFTLLICAILYVMQFMK
jgi:hypothetical protein